MTETRVETLPAVVEPRELALVTEPAPVAVLLRQVRVIHDAMSQAMQENEHYGVIPGTKGKPTLLKAGAEKLSLLFRLRPQYRVTRMDLPGGHREYEIVTDLVNIDGNIVGQGVGLCTTMETRYRYRQGKRKCPSCGAEAIIKGKAEYGGGWLCFKKQDGCGAKYADGDPAIEGQDAGKVENPDLADAYNTVLKMAKKRSLVDGILTVTAASDVFTQDLEDAPRVAPETAPANGADDEAPAPAPTRQAPAKPDPNADMSPDAVARYVAAIGKLQNEYFEVLTPVLAEMGTTLDDVKTILPRAKAKAAFTDLKARCEARLAAIAAANDDGGGESPTPETVPADALPADEVQP